MCPFASAAAPVVPPSLLHLTRMSIRRHLRECIRDEGAEPPRPECYIELKRRMDAELKEQQMREEAAHRERERQRREAAELLGESESCVDAQLDDQQQQQQANREEADAEDEVNERMVCVKRSSRRNRDRDSGIAPSERTSTSSTGPAPSNSAATSGPKESAAAQFGIPPARENDGDEDESPIRIVYRGSRGGIGFFQYRPAARRSTDSSDTRRTAAAAAKKEELSVERQDSNDGRAARMGRHSESEEEASLVHTPVRLPQKRSSSRQTSQQEQSIEEYEETAGPLQETRAVAVGEAGCQPSAKRRDSRGSSSGSSSSLSLPELDEAASSVAQSSTRLHRHSPRSSEEEIADASGAHRFSTPQAASPATEEPNASASRPRGASDAAAASNKRLLRKHRHRRSKRLESPKRELDEQDSATAVKNRRGIDEGAEEAATAEGERERPMDTENRSGEEARVLRRRSGSRGGRSSSRSSGDLLGDADPSDRMPIDQTEADLFHMLGIRFRVRGSSPHVVARGSTHRTARGEAAPGDGSNQNPGADPNAPEAGVENDGHRSSDSGDEAEAARVRRRGAGVPLIGAEEELPVDPNDQVYKNLFRARIEPLVLPLPVKRYLMFE